MQQRILLITGWGGGTGLLQPLQHSLKQHGIQVDVLNIFNAADPVQFQQQLERAKDYSVLMGWSLGGQLATLLADALAQSGQAPQALISLASNPCFVAQAAWPHAMAPKTFQQFKQGFAEDAAATLKRFGYLVCQGSAQSRQDLQKLQSLIQPQSLTLLKQGLALLEQLNLVTILKNYPAPQYHLLARVDQLVPCQVAQDLQNLAAKNLQVEVVAGSHGISLFETEVVTQKIIDYLEQLS